MNTGVAGTVGQERAEARAEVGLAACVHRLVEEVCNEGRLAVLDDVLAASAQGTDVPSVKADAVANLRPLLAAFRAAVPDARWTIVEQIAQSDTVVTRLTVQGTFSGPLLGLAAPGRPATLTGVAISRFARGRLVDLWLQADLLGLLQQLGVLPPLDLTQALTMARVAHTGALLAAGYAPRGRPRMGRRDGDHDADRDRTDQAEHW